MFDHEKLKVYQRSLDFVDRAAVILEAVPKRFEDGFRMELTSTRKNIF